MSNVSTKYSTVPIQNTKLGSLSLEEGKTRYRDLNDLFRQLMADARVESNEVRSLVSAATASAANAKASALTAQSAAERASESASLLQGQIGEAINTAEDAENAAETALARADQALSDAVSAQSAAAAAQSSASTNAAAIETLNSMVNALSNAQQADATLVQVDGTTMSNANGILKALDIEIAEGVLASERGQVGRSAVSTDADMDELVEDGWYAVGGENASSLPAGIVSGVVRVSSGYASGSVVQMLFCPGSVLRCFARSSIDGTTWLEWKELIFLNQIGTGLTYAEGTLSCDLSSVLPTATEADADKVLSGSGTWIDVVSADAVQAIQASLTEMADSVSALSAEIEAVRADAAIPPDGTTVTVTDGTLSVPLYFGATEEADGVAGLVPPAEAGQQNMFLRGDGTYASPELSQADVTGATEEADGEAGLVPAPLIADRLKFLRGDGTYADPTEGLAEQVEEIVQQLSEQGGSGSSPEEGAMTAMTNADIDWIVLGVVQTEEEEGE